MAAQSLDEREDRAKGADMYSVLRTAGVQRGVVNAGVCNGSRTETWGARGALAKTHFLNSGRPTKLAWHFHLGRASLHFALAKRSRAASFSRLFCIASSPHYAFFFACLPKASMETRAYRAKQALRRAPPRAVKLTNRLANARAHGRVTRSTSSHTRTASSEAEPAEDSSDDDRVLALPLATRRRTRSSQQSQQPPRKKRRFRPHSPDDEDDDEDELAYLSPLSNDDGLDRAARAPKASQKKQWPQTTTKKTQQGPAKEKTAKEETVPVREMVIPPWHTLPYLILVSILDYAAAPLNDDVLVRWLTAAGRTCRAFAEPAATALYRSPPLLSASKVYRLTALLARPPSTTMFNYRQKVEVFRIDVGLLALRPAELEDLITNCPRLTELDICHYKDMSPYRRLDDNLRWTYPAGFFEKLGAHRRGAGFTGGSPAVRLKRWRWSQRMMGKDWSFADIKALHMSPPFSGLQKITFVNYQRPSLMAKDAEDPLVIAEDKKYAEVFAGLLAALPDLQHVVIESSTAANEMLLPMLPKMLRHLELINCWDVTAEHFADYLGSHGRELRNLTLHHNQSLSLAFLPVLERSCPKLESLRMNLTYYSHHEFYNDSSPMYDAVLLADEVPTWPTSLQVIELEHLRQWDADAAEVFFQSLAFSAPRLPMLRRLTIKAMLDIPWRQRSEVRDKWVATLNGIYKRESGDPTPAHTLQPAGPGHRESAAPAKPAKKARGCEPGLGPASRRSGRIASLASGSSSRRSSAGTRLKKSGPGRISYRELDSDEDDDAADGDAAAGGLDDNEDAGARPPSEAALDFIQGLCDVVDIRFDNQKPMETQYGMDDFLNSDHANSDDEWTGDDDGTEVGYAW